MKKSLNTVHGDPRGWSSSTSPRCSTTELSAPPTAWWTRAGWWSLQTSACESSGGERSLLQTRMLYDLILIVSTPETSVKPSQLILAYSQVLLLARGMRVVLPFGNIIVNMTHTNFRHADIRNMFSFTLKKWKVRARLGIKNTIARKVSVVWTNMAINDKY